MTLVFNTEVVLDIKDFTCKIKFQSKLVKYILNFHLAL